MGRALPLIAFTATCVAGCYAAPESDAPKTPANTVRRIFAPDLSTSGFAARSRSIERTVDVLAEEPARVASIPVTTGVLAEQAAKGAGSAPRTAKHLAAAELDREPMTRLAQAVEDAPDLAAGRVRHAVDRTPEIAGLSHRPLGEIDDDRHRTDPDDVHPEATWWERIRRRLRL